MHASVAENAAEDVSEQPHDRDALLLFAVASLQKRTDFEITDEL